MGIGAVAPRVSRKCGAALRLSEFNIQHSTFNIHNSAVGGQGSGVRSPAAPSSVASLRNFVVNLVGSSACSRIDKVDDKAFLRACSGRTGQRVSQGSGGTR
jgi:hypothetical protein